MTEWISVKDRLPDFYDGVLVYDNCGYENTVSIAYRREGSNGGWIWDSQMVYPEDVVNVTHGCRSPHPRR